MIRVHSGCATLLSTYTRDTNFQKSPFLAHPVYVCYVDFEKAFDRINCVNLMAILTDIQVDCVSHHIVHTVENKLLQTN